MSPDSGYGFMMPESRMKFIAPETWAGIKAVLTAIV